MAEHAALLRQTVAATHTKRKLPDNFTLPHPACTAPWSLPLTPLAGKSAGLFWVCLGCDLAHALGKERGQLMGPPVLRLSLAVYPTAYLTCMGW
jgi:hypothetical protein